MSQSNRAKGGKANQHQMKSKAKEKQHCKCIGIDFGVCATEPLVGNEAQKLCAKKYKNNNNN